MRELRVRIDASQVVRLHAIRVLRGKPVGQTVQEALDLYFRQGQLD